MCLIDKYIRQYAEDFVFDFGVIHPVYCKLPKLGVISCIVWNNCQLDIMLTACKAK